ncbi:protein Teyrha-meyrha isoform X1 [Stomoxys calcitrans]|uniref:protein Teyrha-meyrha isoform X1 n=1 Tax=Stomoxys calcitrans TaxID=35570 RepID=UPI0027E3619A|nr:protein Teyrha-meyrha isoform X1 [Stomoxys calcitrans]
MESNAFGSSHIPSQALVVLSEAASGLHEALRGQRPFPSRYPFLQLPDAKDLHNMSLVGSYGSHLLHSFHPHLLQTLNHGMLAANGTAAAASYFASERAALGKPSVLGNFQLPSAFSPPKYIGISLDQTLFNGNDSFRTDSASPTCTSHESMEGSNDYDAEKGESPRSNASDPRDLRHTHRSDKPTTSCASSMAAVSAAAAAAVASIASSQAAAAASSNTVMSHLSHHPHPHAHHAAHHLPTLSAHHHHHHPNSSLLAAASMSHSLGLTAPPGLRPPPGHVPDMCPVCGIKLTPEEWNSHFLTELDRLYKLSSGMERTNLQATYMFAPPCPSQENAIRTSHNRWETFQRIRNNRQNRLRIKVRKRKYGDMYFMENMFCNSCPICKRKYALETGKLPPDEENKHHEEIETVDVESCNDEMPDSNSEMQQVHHAHMPALSGSSSHSSSHSSSNGAGSGGAGGGGGAASTSGTANLHNSNSQPGKLDGILYRTTACVINKDGGGHNAAGEEDVSTNVATTSSSTSSNSSSAGSTTNWTEAHAAASSNNNHGSGPQGHISVKNVSELSSTTHHYYNADSCNEERTPKDMSMDTCNNDSDEDVIVDDDDSIKMSQYSKKRKYEEAMVGSSRISDNPSPVEERPRSEPQVTSTEPSVEHSLNSNNNNNNNNTTKYTAFEDLRSKHQQHHTQQQQQQQQPPNHQHSMAHQAIERDSPTIGHGHGGGHGGMSMTGLTQLDTKVGNSSDIKPDEEDSKCFICKTGIKDFAADTFLRGRNFYFHQSCANVMSSYRLNKELQQQQHQQTEVGSTDKNSPPTSLQQPAQHQHVDNSNLGSTQNES